jgi:L-fucose mutarotase/ribose pyranase (RbsD/FucU family)
MLKTLTDLHTPELLHALASMGHEQSRQAFAIVATGEQRTHGCIIVKKGAATGG